MKVYIPSYLGKDPKLVAKRIAKQNAQLEWLLASDKITKIVLCSQEYPSDLKMLHDKVHYIDAPAKGPSAARNILLQHFYQSGDEMCMFMDNDITSDLYAVDLFINLANELSNYTDWNLVGFIPHGHSRDKSLPDTLNFKRKTLFATGAFFVKGIKDLYFDENLQSLEDVDFAMQAMTSGYSYYEIEKYCLFDHSYADSVIYEGRDREKEYEEIRKQIRNKYDEVVKKRGYSSMQSFINSFKQPKAVEISTLKYQARKLF